jgi:O-antigen/teichoic acid export membrane protein
MNLMKSDRGAVAAILAMPTRLLRRWGPGGQRTDGQTIAASTLYLVMATGVTTLLGYVFWTVAARSFSPHSVGYATALVAAMVLVSELGGLGLGYGAAYVLPTARERWSVIVSSALVLVAMVAGGLGTAFIVAAAALHLELGDLIGSPPMVGVFVATCVLWALCLVFDDILMVERQARLLFLRQSLAAVVRVSLVPIALVLVGLKPGFVLFAAWGASVLVSLVPILILLTRHGSTHRTIRPQLDSAAIRQILPLSFKNYCYALTSMGPYLLLPLIVANVLSYEANAYYYIAYMIANMLLTIIHATGVSVFAHGAAAGDLDRRRFNRIVATVFAFVLPAVIVLIGARDFILGLFGATYVENARTLLAWLILLAIPKTIMELFTTVMRIRQEFRAALGVTAFASGATLLLSILLMNTHGLTGVGISYVASFSVAALYCIYELWLKPGRVRELALESSPDR